MTTGVKDYSWYWFVDKPNEDSFEKGCFRGMGHFWMIQLSKSFKGFFIARNAGLFVCKKFVTTKGIFSNVWLRYVFNIINKIHPNYVIDHYASTTFLRVKIMNWFWWLRGSMIWSCYCWLSKWGLGWFSEGCFHVKTAMCILGTRGMSAIN